MNYLPRILSEADIIAVRALPEVDAARSQLGSQNNKVYFTADLPDSVKQSILENAGINLFDLEQVPCRWIQGDTPAHIDRGTDTFETTFLTYITDGEGEFILGDESYPITAGSGFVFSEGLEHKVVGTNGSARLMIGPMSEQGFAVGGGISADGATETIYIRDNAGTVEFKINDNIWQAVSFALYINNINPDPANNILKVIFTTDITLTDWNQNFWAGTDGIQFGNTSLNADGSRPTITVHNAPNYRGVFLNGTGSGSGYNSIYIYNLNVVATGTSTLDDGTYLGPAGWVCGPYFGKGATANYIVNCYSSGDTLGGAIGTGGIVGAYAGSESGAQLYIYGCSSTGLIKQLDGGIVGGYAGLNGGTVTCEQCWSEGAISGVGSGGIFGEYAALTNGTAQATKCYSTGVIGNSAGGIFGRYAGQAAFAGANQCYSRGNIDTDGGGIFGIGAAPAGGVTTTTNCYSSGLITTTGNGIYGTGKGAGATLLNCYSANNSWSTVAANASLQGVPTNPDLVGTTWVSTGLDQPYELNGIGYTPYTVLIINSANSQLIRSFSQTIQAGENTVSALTADASGNSFTILQKADGDTGSYGTITMSAQTGAISTTDATIPGTYTITLRSIGSYNITTFNLTVTARAVNAAGEPIPGGCCPSKGSIGDVSYETRNEFRSGARSVVEHNTNKNMKFPSYREYLYYKMALAKSNP